MLENSGQSVLGSSGFSATSPFFGRANCENHQQLTELRVPQQRQPPRVPHVDPYEGLYKDYFEELWPVKQAATLNSKSGKPRYGGGRIWRRLMQRACAYHRTLFPESWFCSKPFALLWGPRLHTNQALLNKCGDISSFLSA